MSMLDLRHCTEFISFFPDNVSNRVVGILVFLAAFENPVFKNQVYVIYVITVRKHIRSFVLLHLFVCSLTLHYSSSMN